MANKQVNELTAKSEIVRDDLIPVYDSEEAGTEKLKQVTVDDLKAIKWDPYTGASAKPALILRNGITVSVVSIGAPESAPLTTVSAADFITSVIENGDPPYLYGLNKVGDMPSVIYSDPRDAVITLTCTDQAGSPITVEVWIKDNSANESFVESFVAIQDTDGICPP